MSTFLALGLLFALQVPAFGLTSAPAQGPVRPSVDPVVRADWPAVAASGWLPWRDTSWQEEMPAGSWQILQGADDRLVAIGLSHAVVLAAPGGLLKVQVEHEISNWLQSWLPRPSGEVEELSAVAIRDWRGRWSAVYQRTVGGVPVLGDVVAVTAAPSGAVNAMSMRLSRGPVIELSYPEFAGALAAAYAHLQPTGVSTERDLGLCLVPFRDGELSALMPARRVEIGCEEPFGRWVTTVAGNGDLLGCEDRIRHLSLAGSLRIQADDFGYCDGSALFPAANLELTLHDDPVATVVTGAAGTFAYPYDGTSDVLLTSSLSGPFATIDLHDSEADALLSTMMRPGVWRLLIWNDTNSRADERDAWVHVNRAHAFLSELDPDFGLMDFSIATYVGWTDGNCPGDAWYNYGTLNFCEASGGFANTATIGSIIYHEYCHAITDKLYGVLQPPDDLDEGNSDFYANLMTGDSQIGRGFLSYSCASFIRDSDNDLIYPDDWTGHNHESGQILTGALWHAWQELSLVMSGAEASDLIADLWHGSRLLGLPMNIVDQVLWLFVADDDNGDLTDGTPHWEQLSRAVSRHGFEPPPITYGIEIDHEPLADRMGQIDGFEITATITGSGAPIDPGSPRLWYDVGSGWQDAPLAPLGNGVYSGWLPNGPCEQTLRYYLSAADVVGHVVTVPPPAPDESFGFQILGNVIAVAEDFESDTGWTVGAPEDDATSGFWERADPELVDGSGVISQPEDDATPEPGHLCFVTGAGVGSGPGSYDVDGGRTTLLSPVYDLSELLSATVQFCAWIFSGYNTPDLEPLSMWVSTDGGQNWTSVFSQVRQGGWEQFSVSLAGFMPLTDQVRFKFVMQDPLPPALVEAAVDEFHVFGCAEPDSQPPKVSVLTPRGRVIAPVGTQLLVRWFASDNESLADCSLLLSRNNGLTWPDTLFWRAPYFTSTHVTVTGPPTDMAVLKILVRDGQGNLGEDLSPSLIFIDSSQGLKSAVAGICGLDEIHPNPFNPSTAISFRLTNPADVSLTIYDLGGRLVRDLSRRRCPGGYHTVVWDGRSDAGDSVGSGTYLLLFRAGDLKQTGKLTLLK